MSKVFPILLLLLLPGFVFSQSQQYNQKITNERTGEEILIGRCTRDAFTKSPYSEWFLSNYPTYKSQSTLKTLDSCKAYLDSIKIKIVLGTWCSDSRNNFPLFMAYLDYLKVNDYEIICVNREKSAVSFSIEELNILFVPTFIFYKNGIETGRIVENPVQSLERDMYLILKSSEEKVKENGEIK